MKIYQAACASYLLRMLATVFCHMRKSPRARLLFVPYGASFDFHIIGCSIAERKRKRADKREVHMEPSRPARPVGSQPRTIVRRARTVAASCGRGDRQDHHEGCVPRGP